MADELLPSPITQLVTKLPEWLRHDLASHDAKARERAEEALAAMIAAAMPPPTT